jgi:hypothetical protein
MTTRWTWSPLVLGLVLASWTSVVFAQGLGIWSYDLTTNENHIIYRWVGHIAISPEKKIAIVGLSLEDEEIKKEIARHGSYGVWASSQIRAGNLDGPLKTLWEPCLKLPIHCPCRIYWAPGSQRLLTSEGANCVAVDCSGKSISFGIEDKLANRMRLSRYPFHANQYFAQADPGPNHVSIPALVGPARWAGADGSTLLACEDDLSDHERWLRLIRFPSGKSQRFCPCPARFVTMGDQFEVSDDLSTVCFFCSFPSSRPQDTGCHGVWVWHRGQSSPVHVLRENLWGQGGAVSPNGRYFATCIRKSNKERPYVVLCETTSGKILWKTMANIGRRSLAFDPTSSKLAIICNCSTICVVSLENLTSETLATTSTSDMVDLVWSHDSKQIFYHTVPSGSGGGTIVIRKY